MSTELMTRPEVRPVSSLQLMAQRLSADPDKLLATLKSTVFKGATNEELMALTVVANEYGLNPFIKEIYAFPAKGGGIVPVVSIDGWLRIINDHPQMDGIETEFETDGKALVSCTCRIFRKDRSHPTVATEYLSECKRNTEPWKMEHRMLRHKAIIQCARIAFGFGGIHDEDEGRDITERAAKGREVPQPRAKLMDPQDLPDSRPPQQPEPQGRWIPPATTGDGPADDVWMWLVSNFPDDTTEERSERYTLALADLNISTATQWEDVSNGEHNTALIHWEEITAKWEEVAP